MGSKGSSVIRGNLLALPIGGNFLYVEPIYLQSDKGGSIPEMKRVVLAYQNQLVMTENLGKALIELFGEGAPQPTTLGQSGTLPVPSGQDETEVDLNSLDMTSVIEQMNQIRALLDNLETQLKGLPTSSGETLPAGETPVSSDTPSSDDTPSSIKPPNDSFR